MKHDQGEFDAALAKQHDAGIAWANAKLIADQLEEDAKPFLDSLQNRIDQDANGEHSEAKLKRMAQGSGEYRVYLKGMCEARAAANRARLEYDAAIAWFEGRGSKLGLIRANIEKGIFERGA